jgi:ABC-type antimicrobial peptide transport system permease subunit
VYGVLAYTAAQRTREVGMRMALGARRAQVMALFLKQAAVLAACGTVVGLVGALLMGRLLATMLFETPSTDLLSASATVALLLIAGLAAGWLPALRASRIDPMLALRSE